MSEPGDPDYKHHLDGFEANWLYAHHLKGKEANVEISEYCPKTEYYCTKTNSKKHKPSIKFKGKKLPLLLNKTNSNSIAALHGVNANEWIGKWITIYDDGVTYNMPDGGTKKGAIRVKSKVPK